jgi:hypothetical protein
MGAALGARRQTMNAIKNATARLSRAIAAEAKADAAHRRGAATVRDLNALRAASDAATERREAAQAALDHAQLMAE